MDTWERLLDVKVLPSKYRQLRVAGDQSSPPPTDKLLISIRIVRFIRQYFTPGDVDDDDHNNDYTQHTERSEDEIFELHRSNTLGEGLSRILSSIGIPIDYHSQIRPKIISQLAAAQTTQNHIYDVPFLTVVILIGTLRMPNEEDEMIRRATEESMIDTFKPGPASRSSIEALEKAKYVQGLDYSSIKEADQQCMICLEKLLNTSSPAAVLKYEVEQVTRMPCLHLYHGHCIVRWLETSNVCPVCRFQMPTTTT